MIGKMPHRVLNFSSSGLHVRHFESVCHTGHNKPPDLIKSCMPVKQSYALSGNVMLLACKKQGHEIHTCSFLRDEYLQIGSALFESYLSMCMNCLRKGHVAKKCQSPPMRKKCTKHHHTLLLRDDDYLWRQNAIY